jgi:hypothetical protein
MYKVAKYIYNGMFVTIKTGLTNYEAEFQSWTTDPGVAIFNCTDKKQRLIPTCAIVDFDCDAHPKQPKLEEKNMGFCHIGMPSSS